MARNDDFGGVDRDEDKGSGLTGALMALIIIMIWLVIFSLLIKMDVGGIGSMLRPVLKNIPVVSNILPPMSDEELMEQTGYKYKSLAEAIERIKELENEVAKYQNDGSSAADTISELQAEVARLSVYEQNQKNFLEEKERFDREVVFTDNAPDIENYKEWYDTIYPDNAARIYREVCERLQFSQQVKDWATTYANMDAGNAAAIMEEMTGDAYIVTRIMLCMTPKQRAAILAEMDPVYAGKLTAIMFPSEEN